MCVCVVVCVPWKNTLKVVVGQVKHFQVLTTGESEQRGKKRREGGRKGKVYVVFSCVNVILIRTS